jgi:hypothetical protein
MYRAVLPPLVIALAVTAGCAHSSRTFRGTSHEDVVQAAERATFLPGGTFEFCKETVEDNHRTVTLEGRLGDNGVGPWVAILTLGLCIPFREACEVVVGTDEKCDPVVAVRVSHHLQLLYLIPIITHDDDAEARLLGGLEGYLREK